MVDIGPEDRRFLARAVDLARKGMRGGKGGPFGAVIVKDGQVLADGWNQVTSDLDPTAHAEINAIRRACNEMGTFSLDGTTLYSICEPCAMCLGAIYWARIGRLVFANTREDAAAIGFDDLLIYTEIPKPVDRRKLPTLHTPNEDARAVFAEWLAKPDKVRY
jgi:tRNA(Arg) A34 adenosine deaminase TadA